MSFLSSLFKKNPLTQAKKQTELPTSQRNNPNSPTADNTQKTAPAKGYPSSSGLYPSEAMMLFFAPKFKTTEGRYPDFFRTDFGVGFPKELFEKLNQTGYIRPSLSNECLDKLKLADLRVIAADHGIKVGGKKAELIERIIQAVSIADLDQYHVDRYWVLTEKGQQEKEENSYLDFFTNDHPYSLKDSGITFLRLNELHHGNPTANIRDVIWGELNRLSIDTYAQANRNGNFGPYCHVLNTMSSFVEEESRFLDAIQLFFRYQFYRINFQAGMNAIQYLTYVGTSDAIASAASSFYMDSKIYPYEATRIQKLMADNNFDSNQLQKFILDTFSKISDQGFFSNKDLVSFIMSELSGNSEIAEALCVKATKNAKKRIKS